MPEYQQILPLNHNDTETVLPIAYQALTDLGWKILFAGENNLVAHKPGTTFGGKGQQVSIIIFEGELYIKSEMFNGEIADMLKVNKKNTDTFIAAFEKAKGTPPDILETHKPAIADLRQKTVKTIEEETIEMEEMDKAMNISGTNIYVTIGLIAINILIFILMLVDGAGLITPNGYVHMKWGSNFGPLTLSGEPWRLITCVFIHFGVLHLLMNMYCLYIIGNYLERMLGKGKFLAAYLCTGIFGSIVSLWWHTDPVNSAGASGAVFGMYGVFLALLASDLIPKKARTELLKNIGFFILFNLFYGMKSGVDNAGHVGGLLSGLIIGFIYIYVVKKERREERPLSWVIPVISILTLAAALLYMEEKKMPAGTADVITKQIKGASYSDHERFNNTLNKFDELHQEAFTAVYGDGVTDEQMIPALVNKSRPKLDQAEELMRNTRTFDISQEDHEKADGIIRYIDIRRSEFDLLEKILTTKDGSLVPELDSIRNQATVLMNELSAR